MQIRKVNVGFIGVNIVDKLKYFNNSFIFKNYVKFEQTLKFPRKTRKG